METKDETTEKTEARRHYARLKGAPQFERWNRAELTLAAIMHLGSIRDADGNETADAAEPMRQSTIAPILDRNPRRGDCPACNGEGATDAECLDCLWKFVKGGAR